MKKAASTILGITLITLGLGAVLVSGYLLLQSTSWLVASGLVSFLLLGAAIVLAGWGIARGDSIRDIIENLFLGFMQ
jgi:hypothetical protein